MQLDVFDSAGSRPVIVRNLKDPRTRRPNVFTANYPHRDCGMKEFSLSFGKVESGVEKMRQGSAQAVRVRNVQGDFFGGSLVSGKRSGLRFCSDGGAERGEQDILKAMSK